MTDWNTHKSGSIKLLMILVFFWSCLQKKGLNYLFCHITTTKRNRNSKLHIIPKQLHLCFSANSCWILQIQKPNHIIWISRCTPCNNPIKIWFKGIMKHMSYLCTFGCSQRGFSTRNKQKTCHITAGKVNYHMTQLAPNNKSLTQLFPGF